MHCLRENTHLFFWRPVTTRSSKFSSLPSHWCRPISWVFHCLPATSTPLYSVGCRDLANIMRGCAGGGQLADSADWQCRLNCTGGNYKSALYCIYISVCAIQKLYFICTYTHTIHFCICTTTCQLLKVAYYQEAFVLKIRTNASEKVLLCGSIFSSKCSSFKCLYMFLCAWSHRITCIFVCLCARGPKPWIFGYYQPM